MNTTRPQPPSMKGEGKAPAAALSSLFRGPVSEQMKKAWDSPCGELPIPSKSRRHSLTPARRSGSSPSAFWEYPFDLASRGAWEMAFRACHACKRNQQATGIHPVSSV